MLLPDFSLLKTIILLRTIVLLKTIILLGTIVLKAIDLRKTIVLLRTTVLRTMHNYYVLAVLSLSTCLAVDLVKNLCHSPCACLVIVARVVGHLPVLVCALLRVASLSVSRCVYRCRRESVWLFFNRKHDRRNHKANHDDINRDQSVSWMDDRVTKQVDRKIWILPNRWPSEFLSRY